MLPLTPSRHRQRPRHVEVVGGPSSAASGPKGPCFHLPGQITMTGRKGVAAGRLDGPPSEAASCPTLRYAMKLKTTYGTTLAVPIEEAFAFVTAPESWPQVSRTTVQSLSGWGEVGGKAQVVQPFMGRSIVSELELVEWEAPVRFRYPTRNDAGPTLETLYVFSRRCPKGLVWSAPPRGVRDPASAASMTDSPFGYSSRFTIAQCSGSARSSASRDVPVEPTRTTVRTRALEGVSRAAQPLRYQKPTKFVPGRSSPSPGLLGNRSFGATCRSSCRSPSPAAARSGLVMPLRWRRFLRLERPRPCAGCLASVGCHRPSRRRRHGIRRRPASPAVRGTGTCKRRSRTFAAASRGPLVSLSSSGCSGGGRWPWPRRGTALPQVRRGIEVGGRGGT
jgi:hypothetical protein